MRSYLKYISITLLISVLCGALFLYWGYYKFHEIIARDKAQIILLKKGQGLISVAWALKKQNIIDDVQLFRAGVMISGYDRKLKAGEYLIPRKASLQEIMMVLASGKVIQHRLTVIEGWTSWQIVDYLNKIDNLEDKLKTLPAEGTLLPETYIYSHGDSRKSILNRMVQDMDKLLHNLWEGRADNLPFKTKEEAVILASIVEKETGMSGERAHVASIFINRLNIKMRLQSDPTIIYGLTRKGSLGHGLKRSEMNKKTPYNTYQINGLPPTAIAHPSAAAIRAVLNPIQTKDLYFVADGTGGHAFSETLDEHLNNVKKWRKIERQNKNIIK